jgi:NodT family efflux transporter outer membrane factor (OMF) lipoprotein
VVNGGAKFFMLAGAAAITTVATASAAADKIVVPTLSMPPAYERHDAGEAAPTAALDQWWLRFGDAQLDALEEEAMRNGPDALTAAARVIEAAETRKAQTAQTWPSGSIAGTASRQRTYDLGGDTQNLSPISGTTDTLSADFNVSWELDLFGRLKTERRIAAADAAEARFDIEGTRASLAAAVADTYFQIKGLAIQLADARETVRIQNGLLDIARRKARAGAGPEDEIDRVASGVSQATAQADDLAAQMQAARRQLLILVGRGLAADGELAVSGDPPAVPPTPATLPSELLARRPDVREAEFRLRSQIGQAHLKHLAVFPTITLLPALGLSRTVYPGDSFIPPSTVIPAEVSSNQGFWTLAAGVNVPTLDIPKLLYQARAEDARARQAAIAYERTVQAAFGDAQNALTSLAASEKAGGELIEGEAQARRAYEGSRRRYAAGLDDLTATLTTEQTWRSARSAETSERIATLRHAVQVYKALGGGWAFSGQGS